MIDLYPTRTRLDLLRAVAHGRVYLSTSGHVMRRGEGPMINRRCDAAIREQEKAGWVRLGADAGTYEPTDQGRALLDGGAS